MKKLLTVVVFASFIMLMFVSSSMIIKDDQMIESTDEIQIDENSFTTEPDEIMNQTVGNESTDDEEYAGSGNDEFLEKYTIVRESGNRRISVYIDGVDSFLDVLNATVIQTAEGEPVIRHMNKLYILESDTVAREVATIWEVADETVEFSLRSGDYVFTLNTELVDITVKYLNNKYVNNQRVEQMFFYDLENVSSVRLEVSNYYIKEVRCFLVSDEGETEILPKEIPRDVWGYFFG